MRLLTRLGTTIALAAPLLAIAPSAGAVPKNVDCSVPHHNRNVNSYYLAGWCEQDVPLWLIHITGHPHGVKIARWKVRLQEAYFTGMHQRMRHDHIGRSSCQHGICGGFS